MRQKIQKNLWGWLKKNALVDLVALLASPVL